MSETACCAHLRVSYQTETLPNVGTHGWWACDDCPKRFAPISNTLSDGETVRPIERPIGILPHIVGDPCDCHECRRRSARTVNSYDHINGDWLGRP